MADLDTLEYKTRLLFKNNIDLENRIIYLTGSVGDRMYSNLSKGLSLLHVMSPAEPVTLAINSPGGDVYSMFAIVDLIRTHPLIINTRGTGEVMSAAVPILAAGDNRAVTGMTTIMIHTSSYSAPFTRITTHETELKHTKDIEKRVNTFMAAVTTKPFTFWMGAGKHTDMYIDSQTALSWGLVDEVLEGP